MTVFITGTTTKATIYADGSNTPLTNPFQAKLNGQWLLYAATTPSYDIQLSGGFAPNTYTTPLVLTDVPAGGGGGGGGGSPGGVNGSTQFNNNGAFGGDWTVNACAYPGADICAKINAVDQAFPSTPVQINFDQSCGTVATTTCTISPTHLLYCNQGGTYTLLQGNVMLGSLGGVGHSCIMQMAANQTGGIFQLANSSSANQGGLIENVTFDGNMANAPASCSSNTYNCAHGIYVPSNATSAPTNVTIRNNGFQNFFGFPIFFYPVTAGNPEASNFDIENNTFGPSQKEDIKIYGFGANLKVTNNTASGYGSLLNINWADAVYWAEVLNSCSGTTPFAKNWSFTNNTWNNTAGETKFAVELYGGTSACSYVDGFVYSHNIADAGGSAGGIGFSGGSAHAVIDSNVFKNCIGWNDRCGLEISTNFSVISNNSIYGGNMSFYPAPQTNALFTNNVIANNTVKNGGDAGTGIAPILLTTGGVSGGTTAHVTMTGNNLDNTLSACTVNDPLIQVGAGGAGQTVSDVNITGGNLNICNGAGGYGLRIATASGGAASNITASGIHFSSTGSTSSGVYSNDTTGDTDLHFINNRFRGVPNPFSLTLPNNAWNEWGNDYISTPGPFNTKYGYSVGNLEIIDQNGNFLPQVTVPLSGSYSGLIANGSFGEWFPQGPEILTQLEYSLSALPSGCTGVPIAFISDATLGTQIAGTSVNVSGLTGSTGPISISMPSGHKLTFAFGTGSCATPPDNPTVTGQFKTVTNSPYAVRSAFFLGQASTNMGSFTGSGETIAWIDVSSQVAPVTCSVSYPSVSLYDQTASATISGTTVTFTTGQKYVNSGLISAVVPSGHQAYWQYTAGSGCSTALAAPQIIWQYTSGYLGWSPSTPQTPSSGGTITFGSFTPQSNLFVSSMGVSLLTAPSAQSTYQIYDATASAPVSGTLATIPASQTTAWTPNLAGQLFAGHQYQIKLTGCSTCTEPADPNVSVTLNQAQLPQTPLANLGIVSGTITLSTATSDSVTIQGVGSSSVCTAFSTNSTAAASTTLPYIGVSANTVTITHAATVANGATFNIQCIR